MNAPVLNQRCVLYCAAATAIAFGVIQSSSAGEPQRQKASSRLVYQWPAVANQTRPWTYWWWMGSAVDKPNLTRQLIQFQQAGFGGVHIIPIYGAKSYERQYIDYLSPQWMEMLRHTVTEARRLGLDVDMTTGSGWCFGGPRVTDQEANASVQMKRFEVSPASPFSEKLNAKAVSCVVAFSTGGVVEDLTSKMDPGGNLKWAPAGGSWQVYVISQRPSGQKVKRAGPGGQGHMLNLFYPPGVKNYVGWFDEAFGEYDGPRPRAMYHDSYEYRSDWSPGLLADFQKLRGYRLQNELPSLFDETGSDRAARVKTDYRETLSDIMVEQSMPIWTRWSHKQGFITRNEAHGAPGNWLDLYACADVPETEMFHTDRNKLISKFASSAAHVTGKQLIASETGTWLKEHFTETLADMKYLLDDLFLSGVNHIFYHGSCYSPEEAPWPGWLFYASYEMNSRNSVWRDVGSLNAYAIRCQAVLQEGKPDNDVLLYWPIHDFWHGAKGLTRNLTVHSRDWFEEQPVGKTAEMLWNQGYAFDYVSDRQVQAAKVERGSRDVRTAGGSYQVVLVPLTRLMPEPTLKHLLSLADSGATIIFEDHLPQDVPGWGKLESRRTAMRRLLQQVKLHDEGPGLSIARLGKGRVMVGRLEAALKEAGVVRESLFDKGLMAIRRTGEQGVYYFVANRSETNAVRGWVPLAKGGRYVTVMDPLSGKIGAGKTRSGEGQGIEVLLSLPPGGSVVLFCSKSAASGGERWRDWATDGSAQEVKGEWRLSFLAGGPELPGETALQGPKNWADLADPKAQNFAGTGRYRVKFDLADWRPGMWKLDLGRVCQSARVRLNGRDLGTLFVPPFQVATDELKAQGNVLEAEVTNVSANRIRDLDRRKVEWKVFNDINFVNINYKPFDASNWLLTESGLIGPVTVTPVKPLE